MRAIPIARPMPLKTQYTLDMKGRDQRFATGSLAYQPHERQRFRGSLWWAHRTVMSGRGPLHALPRRSIADRFTPVSGIDSRSQALQSRANSRHMAVQQKAAYSMTSSARASSVGGSSMPSVLAVLRLITHSYFVGAGTG